MTVLVDTQPSPDTDSSLSTAPPELVVIIPDDGHCNWGEVASQSRSNSHFPGDSDVEHFKNFLKSYWLSLFSFENCFFN